MVGIGVAEGGGKLNARLLKFELESTCIKFAEQTQDDLKQWQLWRANDSFGLCS